MRTRMLAPLVAGCLVLALAALTATGLLTPATASVYAANPAWTDLNGPRGGSAQALAVNPNYPTDQTVLAGGGRDLSRGYWIGLGLFRSTDGGLTWGDPAGPANGAVLDVAFSPNWQNDGFAAAALFQGVWTTSDHGATWQNRLGSVSSPAMLGTIAVGPAPSGAAHTLLTSGPYGLAYRSPDSGLTWTQLPSLGGVRAVSFHPTQPGLVLAAGSGLWRSTDDGVTWTRVFSATQAYDVDFAAGGATAYATADNQVWRSTDTGLTWQAMNSPAASGFDPLGVSADNAALFTAAGHTLYRYDVAAAAFVTVTSNLPPNYILRIAPSPLFGTDHTLLVGTYDGVFRSTDGGATFTPSQGFAPFALTGIDGPPGAMASGDLFAAGDYGVWKRGAAGDWLPVNNGIIGQVAYRVGDLHVSPAYAQDGTLFVAATRMHGIGALLYKSTDRGASWRNIASAAAVGPIALSPTYGQDQTIFLLNYARVDRSKDGGATWSTVPFWDGYRHSARLLAVSPAFAADHGVYAVGTEIYYSHDGGNTWQTSTVGPHLNSSYPDGWWADQLVAGPSGRLYLAVHRDDSTPPYTRHNQLWTSSDRGVTWQQLTNAPDLFVHSLAAGQTPGATTDRLYLIVTAPNPSTESEVTTDLLVSPDSGLTWQNLGAMPNNSSSGTLNPVAGAPGSVYFATVGAWLFAPVLPVPTATPDPCSELLINRNFEDEGGWRIPQTAYPAGRTQDKYQSPYWSMRTGILDPAANVRSYSDFSQDVTLPAGKTISLRIYRWPTSGVAPTADADTAAADAAAAANAGALAGLDNLATVEEFYQALEAAAGDFQYGMVIAPPGGKIKYLFTGLRNDRAWIEQTFDLSAYAGQTVRLQFGTYNDGAGPVAAQYFDTFKLLACGQVAPTPTPTSTPAAHTWLPVIKGPPAGGTIPSQP